MDTKKIILFCSFILFCNTTFSQALEIKEKIKFNLKGGFGGNYSIACGQFGLTENIGAYTEFTLSKKYKGWKFNIGPRVNNKNFTWDNDDNINVSLLFIDIPLLFSYDFDLGTNNTFRLELGPYYSQYIAGAIFIDNKKIAGAFNNGYYSPFNAGLIVGGGFWHNDFYIGADFDFIWDWAGEDAFPSFYMTAGYRF